MTQAQQITLTILSCQAPDKWQLASQLMNVNKLVGLFYWVNNITLEVIWNKPAGEQLKGVN